MINLILVIIGLILIAIGVFCDFIGAIGLIRLPNFYTRLHAATVGAIGGAVVPIIGAAILALGYEPLGEARFILAGVAFAIKRSDDDPCTGRLACTCKSGLQG
jgi:multicomponent Na+:H+ antiporter subunit G